MIFPHDLDRFANLYLLHRIAEEIADPADIAGIRQFHQHPEIRAAVLCQLGRLYL